ncbi:bifunctional hydroxymethylpyrimidine kinase/phosphomethylpyrimidine kinase [Roseateles amylovorans]|uniref:hydroxymethylpyrimidine kinase n=1 Tax=Roseateles amylovorans TaxID=2978473 RepID=A0ABY6AY75_9BURK|nr:bifunctional hydroxymethylpyrimidine kinase/phosphomethylpyrimidine kinase [Roseateles amylovorans]UXH77857.1 bifunctional hydroxymethylpyrimidine kinase/phosphomethylpyrimidine kinase [Roseateles amylovorans]
MEGLIYPHPSLASPWAPEVDPDLALLMAWTEDPVPPVIWSVAGTDSGGGAGLSADTRAAAAMGVHLCPVVAAVTAQHSQGVQAVFPLPADQLRAQLTALRQDMPARVIKTGLLASAPAIDALLAQRGDAALVVDPVLGATAGGAAFCDDALLSAYRHQLIPQAALLTPNRREAERLLGVAAGQQSVPELARGLRQLGAQAVCITGGDEPSTDAALALDWLDSPLASGWLALPRLTATPDRPLHHHGSGCTFATAAAAALARGFAVPDAVVLAKMLTWAALRDGHAAGAGAGPLRPSAGFVDDPTAMPVMGFEDETSPDATTLARWERALTQPDRRRFEPGLYAIADQPSRVAALAASGRFAHVQLRIKRAEDTSDADLTAAIRETVTATAGDVGRGTTLWINDHWRLAVDAGAQALHLGQEDWGALTAQEREELLQLRRHRRLGLGLSSHSLWELCRARGLTPSYIACGPVWPTTTKRMPWLPQGLAQLRWWARMAGYPVVAIGGILSDRQVADARGTGVAAVCLVRAAEQWIAPPSEPPTS